MSIDQWPVYFLGGLLFTIYLAVSIRRDRRSAVRRRELNAKINETDRRMRAWVESTEPCPTCHGDGRVARRADQAQQQQRPGGQGLEAGE